MALDLGNMAFGQAQSALANGELEQLRQIASSHSDKQQFSPEEADKLREQSTQFEAMILNMMLSSMRKTVEESDLFGGKDSPGRDIYTSMLDSEYARIMSENSKMGIGNMMLDYFGVQSNRLAPALASAEVAGPSGLSGLGRADQYLHPVNGPVSSSFGMRVHPISGQLQMHEGMDMAVPIGTPVKASGSGEVVFAGEVSGYGNLVVVDHGNGVQSLYGHLDSIDVKAGDAVRRGQVIAASGNSGRSTGPHLHFEIRLGGRPVNPVDFVQEN
jgi:murein DD-endopeptidase MepM/ murein hydrolase activator NlpD